MDGLEKPKMEGTKDIRGHYDKHEAGFEACRKHVNPILFQLETMCGMDRGFVHAQGCYIWDRNGNKILDLLSGHGSFSLGHNPPEILSCLKEKADENFLQVYALGSSPYMGELAAKLHSIVGDPFDIYFFSNSGTEAVEGAIKLARAATKKTGIVYCENAYHGTSMGSLSMMATGAFRDPFEPLLPDFYRIPFNDTEALEKILAENACAAFVIEPIQAEGGIRIPGKNYLRNAKEICERHKTLLILDEIQTGLCRTGTFLAFQQEDMKPDIFTIAKSLGGGIMPIGAYGTSREIFERAYGTYTLCASHHSTFGGNSLSCEIALKAIEMLSSKKLLKHVQEQGQYLLSSLQSAFLHHPLVKDIRGRGLLIAIEFNACDHPWLSWENIGLSEFHGLNIIPSLISKDLLKKGILTTICGHCWDVLKIEPPLIIEKSDLDCFLDTLGQTIRWLETIV